MISSKNITTIPRKIYTKNQTMQIEHSRNMVMLTKRLLINLCHFRKNDQGKYKFMADTFFGQFYCNMVFIWMSMTSCHISFLPRKFTLFINCIPRCPTSLSFKSLNHAKKFKIVPQKSVEKGNRRYISYRRIKKCHEI